MMNQFNQMYQGYQNRYTQQNGINWVQGIEGAKAYQLMPNSNIVLLDSENDGVFYIKISDNVGMCSLRIFNYVEVTEQPKNNVDMSMYVTRDELQNILKELKESEENEQSVPTTSKRKLITD